MIGRLATPRWSLLSLPNTLEIQEVREPSCNSGFISSVACFLDSDQMNCKWYVFFYINYKNSHKLSEPFMSFQYNFLLSFCSEPILPILSSCALRYWIPRPHRPLLEGRNHQRIRGSWTRRTRRTPAKSRGHNRYLSGISVKLRRPAVFFTISSISF